VKQEKLPWLADNPFYTKRFAFYVGRRCRSSALRDVARELRLDWKTVKSLEMEYMREQLRRAGAPHRWSLASTRSASARVTPTASSSAT
jgi:transposase